MMEPALSPFRVVFERIRLSAPTRRYVSNLTGTWITPEQSTSPEYYVSHLRNAVLFADGVATLNSDPSLTLLEVGPGTALSSLARLTLGRDGATRVVAEGLRFPNGIAVSADHSRLVVAEMDGACIADYEIESDGSLKLRGRFGSMKSPDGICLDREGAVWVAAFEEDAFIRLDPSGRELQRIEVPGRRALACALGGAERRTLFCLSAATSYEELRQRKSSSRIDVVDVGVAGAGYP